jgi:hypothetical protein
LQLKSQFLETREQFVIRAEHGVHRLLNHRPGPGALLL